MDKPGLIAIALIASTAFATSSFAHHTPEHGGAAHGAASAAVSTAATVPASDLAIKSCWVRTMPAQLPSAGYFIITNASSTPATLEGLSSDAYTDTMLHATQNSGGMAKMVMAHHVTVPAKGEFVFAPGGHHAMLEKPTRALAAGQTVEFVFQFAGGTRLTVPCELRPASTIAP